MAMVVLRYTGYNKINRIKTPVIKLYLQIYINQLAYSFEEYIGELYRMNLSCSGGGLPESGCLFFKVQGKTNTSKGFSITLTA